MKAMCYARRAELKALDVQARDRVSTPSTLPAPVIRYVKAWTLRLPPCQSSTQTLDEKFRCLSGVCVDGIILHVVESLSIFLISCGWCHVLSDENSRKIL